MQIATQRKFKTTLALFSLLLLLFLPRLVRPWPTIDQRVFSSEPVKERVARYSLVLPAALGLVGFFRRILWERRAKRAISEEHGGWRRFVQELSQKPARQALRDMSREYREHRPIHTEAQARFWAAADHVGSSAVWLILLANVALWCLPLPAELWWIVLLEAVCLGIFFVPVAFDISSRKRGEKWLGWGVTWVILRLWRRGAGLALTPRLAVLVLSLLLVWTILSGPDAPPAG